MAQETRNGSTIPDLVSQISGEAERLVQLNIELAKEETKELAIRNGIAVGLLVVGALFAALGILIAVPVLIVEWVPNHVIAAAVWVGLYIVLGLVLVLVGRARLRFEPPRRTIESLKETKEWVVHQLRSSAR